jgi:hypothetical protein
MLAGRTRTRSIVWLNVNIVTVLRCALGSQGPSYVEPTFIAGHSD